LPATSNGGRASAGAGTDIPERQAEVASGLLNTSQQLGGAIGVAIAATVAATHFNTLVGEGKSTNVALTGGFPVGIVGLRSDRAARAATLVILRDKATPSNVEVAVPVLEGQH
jgi:hypothetical protein